MVAKMKQAQFNRAHKKTRVLIEHLFGILKKRFPALLYALRCRKIENVQAIIGICYSLFI